MKRFIVLITLIALAFVGFGQEATEGESPGIVSLLTNWEFWIYILGGAITLLGVLQRFIPTDGKTKTIIDLIIKVFEGLVWILKKLIPDRKKGGGINEDIKDKKK